MRRVVLDRLPDHLQLPGLPCPFLHFQHFSILIGRREIL
jgi:hypothetical protein